MEKLCDLLQVKPGVTALIGGGGKTSLLYHLAEELRDRGTVLVCTTTKIWPPEHLPVVGEVDKLIEALSHYGVACAGTPTAQGKLTTPHFRWEDRADYVLVEADGSKRLPLKAHAPHEPVIPACAGQTVYVVGADGFGRPIAEVCHRPERYAAICGAALGDIVTPALAAKVLLAEGYGGGWVYVNKVETPRDRANAAALAAALPGTVVAGSLHRREYQVY